MAERLWLRVGVGICRSLFTYTRLEPSSTPESSGRAIGLEAESSQLAVWGAVYKETCRKKELVSFIYVNFKNAFEPFEL